MGQLACLIASLAFLAHGLRDKNFDFLMGGPVSKSISPLTGNTLPSVI
ncbi:hypothetical protein N9189_03660 [Pirellulaceae bacterium]|nr:hypothetical protein [Pirellulaceae bacterium]